jgi:hypothetical protein
MYAIVDIDYEQTSSPARYVFAYDPNFVKDHMLDDGAFKANIEDLDLLIEILEDEQDVLEGLKALADEEGTITWEQYQRQRKERELRGELPG